MVRSKAWTVFARSNSGIAGSNPTQGMDVCMCVYFVFMLSCVYVAALRRADHSSKESYYICKNDYETQEEARAQQRAVEPLMNEWMFYFTLYKADTVSLYLIKFHSIKACGEIAPWILKLGTRNCTVGFISQLLYARQKSPR
jgi:hypothetical protein